MNLRAPTFIGLMFLIQMSCTLPSTPLPASVTEALPSPTADAATLPPPTETFTPLPTDTPAPTATSTNTPVPTVESLKAQVTVDLLSCRYGPGSEYLYLYALKKGSNIKLIGQTGGNNWVWVDGKNKCWVNAKFLEIEGDRNSLPVVYPGIAKLPVSPYYRPTTVLKAERDPNDPNKVTVQWIEITLRAGDEEDENMFIYIIEVWRCEGGKIVFDPLASNYPEVSFVDEPGCSLPSHGRVFFQEKHGYAGPAEIPWPAFPSP